MSVFRTDIMALPESERLGYAIDLLEEMTGQAENRVLWFQQRYSISRQQAVVLSLLAAAHPANVSKAQIYSALYGADSEVAFKIVDVLLCKLRRVLPEGAVRTIWGGGVVLTQPIEPPDELVIDQAMFLLPRRWTVRDDADLRRMIENGSDPEVIADELGRSLRACQDRWSLLERRRRAA